MTKEAKCKDPLVYFFKNKFIDFVGWGSQQCGPFLFFD
jgi:hypothetical protein